MPETVRRTISYSSLDEVVADAERLTAANASTTGNWSKGQIFEHLARLIDCSVSGFKMKAPWIVRKIARMLYLKKIFRDGMQSGFKLKGKAKELMMVDFADDQESLGHLRKAVVKYNLDANREMHPFFGKLSKDDWDILHRRHAELHMSFIAESE